jgi:PAS domain S-box-containing protein
VVKPALRPAWALGAGIAAGAALALAWLLLPAAAAAALSVATVAAVVWVDRHQQGLAQALRRQWQAEHEQRLQLERRARQLDEAEHLAALASFDWDLLSHHLHWSRQTYRLWGYEPGSVTPSVALVEQHVHPDDLEQVRRQLKQARDGDGLYDCRHRIVRVDGSLGHVHARARFHHDEQGRPVRMVGAVLDITERVQAEDNLRLGAFVLDALPDTVSAIDSDMNYRLANAAWHRVTGVDRKHAGRVAFDHVFPLVVSPERRAALYGCLNDGVPAVVRTPLPPPLPHPERVMETRFLPFNDPAASWRGVVMVSRDVTDDEALHTALAHGVDNLQLTLNTIADGIFASDATSVDEPVLIANAPLRALWRIADDVQPLTPRAIVDHACRLFADPAAELARIEAIVAGNLTAEDRVVLNDGRVLLRRCSVAMREPRPVRVWAFRDVTAELDAVRALAEAEARQRSLLEAFPGFIWVIDEQHHVVYLNPLAASVYDPLRPEPGVHVEQLFGRRVYERLRPSIDGALAGQTLSVDWHRRSRSGRTPDDMLIRMVPGQGPAGLRCCYAFGIDITSLKQAQAALQAAKDEAERANRAKTQFLSAMSHELRTPLNAIIGFGQLLEQNSDGTLGARPLRQVTEIRKAGQHLLSIINDLLDLARIEAGHTQLELAPVPLADLADECLRLMQPLAARCGRRLLPARVDPQARVQADRVRLKQVLLNLLSNAIKYNRDAGQVALRCQGETGAWLLEVQDQGAGLSNDEQVRLFQPFERLRAAGTGIEGTGIGLALARQLVRAMGGDIGVRSAPGSGSVFWVRLPAATAPPPARLLYIDDNPVNLALMEGLFEGHAQLQLRVSADPEQALAGLQQQPVDLLLVDLQMPGLDGFQVFDRLRADPSTRHLPIIAVSADATEQTQRRCRALGFADYVTKPIDADRLFDAVAAAQQPRPDPSS